MKSVYSAVRTGTLNKAVLQHKLIGFYNRDEKCLQRGTFNDLYCSTNIVRVTKKRRMRWAGHVARMGRGEVYTGFWWGNLRERDHLEDLSLDGKIT